MKKIIFFVAVGFLAIASFAGAQEPTSATAPNPEPIAPRPVEPITIQQPVPIQQPNQPMPVEQKPMIQPDQPRPMDNQQFNQPKQQQFNQPMQPPQPNQRQMNTQQMPGQNQNFKMPMQDNFSEEENEAREKENEARMEEQNKFRVETMKRWATQMEKNLISREKRIATYGAKKIPISEEIKEAVATLKTYISEAKNSTGEDDIDMRDANDSMMTIDDGLRAVEVASQFPKVMKEAANEIKRNTTALKKAETKKSKIKVDVASLLEDWKKDIGEMTSIKNEAQALYDKGEVMDATETIRDNFFEIAQDANEKSRTFDMLSNFLQMTKTAEKDLKNFEKQVTTLKKKGTDTSGLTAIIAQGRGQLASINKLMATTGFDPDDLITSIEELNGYKMKFEQTYFGLTGKGVYGPTNSGPAMAMPTIQQSNVQPQTPQYFNPFGGSAPKSIQGGATCNINGIEMQGSCADLEKKMNTEKQGGTIYRAVQKFINWATY